MKTLDLPETLPVPGISDAVADDDAMFDGRSDHYLKVGLSAMRLIQRALHGSKPPERILDMPCGHGRVTRMLRAFYPDAKITACDIDHAGVDFAVQTFESRGVYSREDFRTLALEEQYDLIWVGSLITHLSEPQTRRFFDFIARHLAPDGTVVITSHGAHVAKNLSVHNYGLTDAAARGVLMDAKTCGYGYRNYPDGDGYGISLIQRNWFEDLFADGPLRLDGYVARGWDNHQDVLILHSRPPTPLNRLLIKLGRAKAFQYDDGRPVPPPARIKEAIDQEQLVGFDEAWYLRTHPDVAVAMAQGRCASGLEHFRAYGWREGRSFCDPSQTYDTQTRRAELLAKGRRISGADRSAAANFVWAAEAEEQSEIQGWYWMAHPTVRARLNTLASGDPAGDAYARLAQLLQGQGRPVPIQRALSLGCGFGGLERDLAARGIVARIDGYDIDPAAIAEARRLASERGQETLHYHTADLETADLPRAGIDVVFAHQSVNHVERLEQMFAKILRTLRPGGLFHLHEFVGPTRFQWTEAQIALVNQFLDSLPEPLRRLPSGKPKPPQGRPTVPAMIAAGPSEAIRSADIESVLAQYFTILERRPLGGSLAHLALGEIAQNFQPDDAEHERILQRLFAMEDEAMRDGVIGSDFVVVVAQKAARSAA